MARTVGLYADLSPKERKKAFQKDRRKARIYKIKSSFASLKKHPGKIVVAITGAVTLLRGIIGLFFDIVSLWEYIFG